MAWLQFESSDSCWPHSHFSASSFPRLPPCFQYLSTYPSLQSTQPIRSTLDRTTYLAHTIAYSQLVCSYASMKIHQRFIVLPYDDPTVRGHVPTQQNHLWYLPHDDSTEQSHDSFSNHDHLSRKTSSQAHFLQLISVCNTINSPSHHVQPMPPSHLCFLHPV